MKKIARKKLSAVIAAALAVMMLSGVVALTGETEAHVSVQAECCVVGEITAWSTENSNLQAQATDDGYQDIMPTMGLCSLWGYTVVCHCWML